MSHKEDEERFAQGIIYLRRLYSLPAWLPPPPLPPELFTILTLLNRAGWPKHLAREGVRMFGCGIKTDRLHFVLMTSWVRQPEKQYLHDFFFFSPTPSKLILFWGKHCRLLLLLLLHTSSGTLLSIKHTVMYRSINLHPSSNC